MYTAYIPSPAFLWLIIALGRNTDKVYRVHHGHVAWKQIGGLWCFWTIGGVKNIFQSLYWKKRSLLENATGHRFKWPHVEGTVLCLSSVKTCAGTWQARTHLGAVSDKTLTESVIYPFMNLFFCHANKTTAQELLKFQFVAFTVAAGTNMILMENIYFSITLSFFFFVKGRNQTTLRHFPMNM